MDQSLAGRSGIVTGGGGVLGRAAVLRLASQGASVLAVDLDGDAAEETARLGAELPGEVQPMQGDLTEEDTISAAIARVQEKWPRLDFLHQNAGLEVTAGLTETSNEDWDRTQDVNVKSLFWGCKYAVRAMAADGQGGSIVNMGSVVSVTADERIAAYSVSKHAVLGLTRAVAATYEYASKGIRCNCLCPGSADTPLLDHVLDLTDDPAGMRKWLEDQYPTGRLVTAEEIADVVAFLVGDGSRAISGAWIPVDGGYLAKLY